MIDYSTGVSLAHDSICNDLRVSTVAFKSIPYYGAVDDVMIETWIFSKILGQPNRQIFHKTREAAVKAHKHIVQNLRKRAENAPYKCFLCNTALTFYLCFNGVRTVELVASDGRVSTDFICEPCLVKSEQEWVCVVHPEKDHAHPRFEREYECKFERSDLIARLNYPAR